MSDLVKPKPPAAFGPQRGISGYLIFSLFLSFGGFLVLPLVGPLIGLGLAFVGRKKVRENEMLIGPRLAVGAIVVAILCLPLQGWMTYRWLPTMYLEKELARIGQDFHTGLRDRKFESIHAMMSPEFRNAHTSAEFVAMLQAAFVGDDPIAFEEEDITVRKEEVDPEELRKRHEAFLSEPTGRLSIEQPLRIRFNFGEVDLTFTVEVERGGYLEFRARFTDLTARRVEPEEKKAEAEPAEEGETTPEEDPKKDQGAGGG
jgi:hypothetical protein